MLVNAVQYILLVSVVKFRYHHKNNIRVKLYNLLQTNSTLLFCQQFTVQLFDNIAGL